MTRLGRAAVMIFLAMMMSRLLLTGDFGWFIQQRMRLPLLLATVVLFGLAIYEAVSGSIEEHRDETARFRSAAPKVGWLMILPLLVLVSVAPTGLGAAAADRVDDFTPTDTSSNFEPLAESDGPVAMRVYDFLDRAIWDDERSLSGATVQLEGLVVNNEAAPDGFLLTRFMVSCCAADGVPLQIALRDVGTTYADDTWVVADVVWREPEVEYADREEIDWYVEADVISITVDPDPPNDAYESPYGD